MREIAAETERQAANAQQQTILANTGIYLIMSILNQAEEELEVTKRRGPKAKVLPTALDVDNFKLEVDRLRSMNFNWTQIVTQLQVDKQWFYKWRKNSGYEQPRITNLTTQELDDEVARHSRDHPRRGEKDVQSRLESDNIHVTRQELRNSVNRVDPGGRELR